MAVSRDTRYRDRTSFWRRLFGQLSWYDMLLAAIPLVLALPLIGYVLFPISLHVAVATGALLGGVLVVDALFVHPPTGTESDTS